MACHLKIYTWKYFWTRECISLQVTLLFIYAFFHTVMLQKMQQKDSEF